MNKILLIIPCFNEARRLNMLKSTYLKTIDLKLCFVDDGSTDDTRDFIKSNLLTNSNISIITFDKNIGKGPCIREACMILDKRNSFRDIDYIGYWDADLSTPIEEVIEMSKQLKSSNVDGLFASRNCNNSRGIKRILFRKILSRAFNFFVKAFWSINMFDTQCGAKLFKKSYAQVVFAKPFYTKWLFDVEIILRSTSFSLIEYPLKKWEYSQKEKLPNFKMVKDVIIDLYMLFKNY